MNQFQPNLREAPLCGGAAVENDLQLREINHRWQNDMQLIISLLSLQARRAKSTETREALQDTVDRVSILARSRASLQNVQHQNLEDALREVCQALQSQAGPRGVILSLETGALPNALPSNKITALALIVNELATNAIKHAFQNRDTGLVKMTVEQKGDRYLLVTVEDDGDPLIEPDGAKREGFGMNLIRRFTDSIGGIIIPPEHSKCFEIRVPLNQPGNTVS